MAAHLASKAGLRAGLRSAIQCGRSLRSTSNVPEKDVINKMASKDDGLTDREKKLMRSTTISILLGVGVGFVIFGKKFFAIER